MSAGEIPRYSVMYPARYEEVVAVGASDAEGNLAHFSNAGSQMDLMAPGVGIVSVYIIIGRLGCGLGFTSGTSMAAPYVTAVAAIIKVLAPELDNKAIEKLLVELSDRGGGGAVGELRIPDTVDEITNWMGDQNPGIFERNEMKNQYRQLLIERINTSGEALWE